MTINRNNKKKFVLKYNFLKGFSSKFKDCQVLIQSDGHVKYLKLTAIAQSLAIAFLICFTVFFVGCLGFIVLQEVRLSRLNTQLLQSKFSHSSFVQESRALQNRLVHLSQKIYDDYTRFSQLLVERNQLLQSLEEVEESLPFEAEKVKVIIEKKKRLRDLESTLMVAYDSQANSTRIDHVIYLVEEIGFPNGDLISLNDVNVKETLPFLDPATVKRYLHVAEVERLNLQEDWHEVKSENKKILDQYVLSQQVASSVLELQKQFIRYLLFYTKTYIKEIKGTIGSTGIDLDLLVERQLAKDTNNALVYDFDARFESTMATLDDDVTFFASMKSKILELGLHLREHRALQDIIRIIPFSSPLNNYYISSKFGVRKDPINGHRDHHMGIDMAAPIKTSVFATSAGRVIFAGYKSAYGRLIEIDHGDGVITKYGHLNSIKVKKGDLVAHRDYIGEVGTSGRVTGSHLHYEILFNGKHFNPILFFDAGLELL